MSTSIAAPFTQVTSTEAAQSGLAPGGARKVSDTQKTRIDKFIKAHLGNLAAQTPALTDSNASATLGKPQVSAEEQAASVGLMGGSRHAMRRWNSKNADLYQALFRSDEDYLDIDLKDYQNAVLKKSQSLVDLSNWSEPQKALRKYLLTEITLEQNGLEKNLAQAISKTRTRLLNEHGDYIRGSIAAVQVGKEIGLSPLKLKDFVRAYQMLDVPQSDGKTPDLIQLFRSLRKSIESGRGTEDMVNMCNGLFVVLKRERSQSPSKATSTRQYLILSRIKQLHTLTKTKSRHTAFLNTCRKAKLFALPTLADLMSTCLQITVGGDTVVGVNNLMKFAGAVGTQVPGTQNMFIPHYSKFVLGSDELKDLFKSNFHQKQVSDHISKSVMSSSILNEGKGIFNRAS